MKKYWKRMEHVGSLSMRIMLIYW